MPNEVTGLRFLLGVSNACCKVSSSLLSLSTVLVLVLVVVVAVILVVAEGEDVGEGGSSGRPQ
jgi:hypothetical protein